MTPNLAGLDRLDGRNKARPIMASPDVVHLAPEHSERPTLSVAPFISEGAGCGAGIAIASRYRDGACLSVSALEGERIAFW